MKLELKILFLALLLCAQGSLWAAPGDLDLADPSDLDMLMDDVEDLPSDAAGSATDEAVENTALEEKNLSDSSLEDDLNELDFDENDEPTDKTAKNEEAAEPDDDLDSLKEDIGEIEFTLPGDDTSVVKEVEDLENSELGPKIIKISKDGNISTKEAELIFEVGKLEKDLLEMAKKMQGKIPNADWNDIAGKSTGGTYQIVNGDWLWKISKNIFGSGFYYSKVWALNPYITNPHEIEPGMILSFSTGSDNNIPALNMQMARKENLSVTKSFTDFDKWGANSKPKWMIEREKLKSSGVYLQYATSDTKEDLQTIGEKAQVKEYETYEPPKPNFVIDIPVDQYDESGFDKNAKIIVKYSDGFHLTTFLSNNIVQDFGKVESTISGKQLLVAHDKIFVRFDQKIDVVVGDKFSIYVGKGKMSNKNSDRKGYKYVIAGNFETTKKHKGVWECKILESSETISRGDRVTVFTPKIERITQTFNPRLIESVLIGGYQDLKRFAAFGDVVYLDRGRADGVEVGNVFEVYGFKDRGTEKNITDNPTYKNGELVVLTVTDNFSTALVQSSKREFLIGDIAITKTKEAAARAMRLSNKVTASSATRMDEQAIDELDIELNLDDLNDALLDKADKIQFTEDELAELERQERQKSVISENERDLRSLERLETELETAEKMLTEARLDEDKLLEGEDLNKVENKFGVDEQESLDELEENFGKRFLDEDLNDKENPYGLTEFDIEEIDELLNADKETK